MLTLTHKHPEDDWVGNNLLTSRKNTVIKVRMTALQFHLLLFKKLALYILVLIVMVTSQILHRFSEVNINKKLKSSSLLKYSSFYKSQEQNKCHRGEVRVSCPDLGSPVIPWRCLDDWWVMLVEWLVLKTNVPTCIFPSSGEQFQTNFPKAQKA